MTHLKLQKLQKGDYPPAHRLSVNVLLSNITFLYSLQFFLHLYQQFYYVSVAVTLFRVRSRLQLDVRNLSLGMRHLVNAYEVEAGTV